MGRRALPVRVPPNIPFSTPLLTCPPKLPSPIRARERAQQSPLPCREGPCGCRAPAGAVLYSPAAGSSSSSSRSGGSGAMGSGGRGAGRGSGAVLGGGACRCEPQRRWAGYKRLLSAPSRVPRQPEPKSKLCCPSGQKGGAAAGRVGESWDLSLGQRSAVQAQGVTPRSSGMGAASPLLHTFLLWELYFLFELQQFLGNSIWI